MNKFFKILPIAFIAGAIVYSYNIGFVYSCDYKEKLILGDLAKVSSKNCDVSLGVPCYAVEKFLSPKGWGKITRDNRDDVYPICQKFVIGYDAYMHEK